MRDSRVQIILIIALFTILLCGFSYVAWPMGFTSTVRFFAVFLLFFFISKVTLTKKQHFRYYVLALAFLPFASVFYSYSEYGQPVSDGIKGTLPSLLWLFYFVFHRYKPKEVSFLKAMLYIAVFIVLVQIIQQFTYPNILFGARDEDNLTWDGELAENRNGIWRFQLGLNGIFTAVCLFSYWCEMRKRGTNAKYAFAIALMLISIYLTLTRQLMFSALLALFLSYFIGKGKVNAKFLFGGAIIIVLLFIYWDDLFGNFTKRTIDENNHDNIRLLAATYFWTETFTSVPAMFLGHGTAVSGSFLALQDELSEQYHYYVSDVGFIGMMWRRGVFYVYLCYDLLIYMFWNWRRRVPLYIRLIVIFVSVPSIMIFPMISPVQYVLWSFLLYICDVYINKSTKVK